MHTFDLSIDDISKMEGKAGLSVKVREGKIEELQFKITEYKRFYTQAIRGKDVVALPQLCARICGTCSNAHLLAVIKAIENTLSVAPSPQTQLLRELVNYGLNIRDHALHCFVFVLPDLMGVDSILDLDENKEEERLILEDTFAIKSAGNNLSKVIGGRSVHAPFLSIGGFSKLPDETKFPSLIAELLAIRPRVIRLIKRFNEWNINLPQKVKFVSMMDDKYSFLKGDILTSDGKVIKESESRSYFEHTVVPYSHASGYRFDGETHFVGALSRLNLGKKYLHPDTINDLGPILDKFPSENIHHNNLAQAIEILHSVDRAVEILKTLKIQKEPLAPIIRKAGTGIGVIEAPRGTLFYQLEVDEKGKVLNGDIIVPTGQNQIGIEKSIYSHISQNMGEDRHVLVHDIEKIVRAYDPCMSCASHFLKVKWDEK